MEAAEAWGVAPWELEPVAPAVWMDRFLAWQDAQGKRAKRTRNTGEQRMGNRVTTRRSL